MVINNSNKKFLNVSEVAQRYGLGKVTIFAKVKAGEFPAGIKIGRSRRWSIDELEQFEKGLANND